MAAQHRLGIVFLLVSSVAGCEAPDSREVALATAASTASCPAGTVTGADGVCFLERDLRLSATLELGSGQTLDCRNRRLLPTATGSGTTLADFVPSQPEVAVAVLEAQGATVRNCGIGTAEQRFDFGVILAGGGGHQVTGNKLHTRTYGIKLLSSSDNLVTGNDVRWTKGFAISVLRNSDRNRIGDNQLRMVDVEGAVGYLREDPGMRHATNSGRVGVNVLSPVAYLPVSTLVLNGRILQYVTDDGHADECVGPCPGYGRAQDNLIEGNQIWLPGAPAIDNTRLAVVAAMMSSRTTFRGNTVHEAGHGVRMAGNGAAQSVVRAGYCGGQHATPVRRCVTSAECHIDGIDAQPLGDCLDVASDTIDAQARETIVEGNTFIGPFNDGRPDFRTAILAGNATVRGVVRGNQIQGTGIEAGIIVATFMLQTGTIEGNRVHGAAYGLLLMPAGPFGARISGNDFVGSTVAGVATKSAILAGPPAYTWPTVLSGNYWGHDEPPCFRDSDTNRPDLVSDPTASCTALAH